MTWRIFAWNRDTRKWGLVGKIDEDTKAEAAIRTIADAGHVARANSDEGEMRAYPHGKCFYRLRWLKSGSDPGTS